MFKIDVYPLEDRPRNSNLLVTSRHFQQKQESELKTGNNPPNTPHQESQHFILMSFIDSLVQQDMERHNPSEPHQK
jgi:hypothetical protein